MTNDQLTKNHHNCNFSPLPSYFIKKNRTFTKHHTGIIATNLKTKNLKKTNMIIRPILCIGMVVITLFAACKKDEAEEPVITSEQKIQQALDAFVADLESNPADTSDLSNRVKAYIQANPDFFFGSTVALLDSAGLAYYSPYWYRSGDSLLVTDLAADPAYLINEQDWLRQPIDSGAAIWTAPYFDAGGGNIWMKTRAVPVKVNGQTVAVATTDLAL
jgi:hypothetical protein